MKILDLSSGNRAIWFNKNHPLACYLDKRSEVHPTIVCDTRNIPIEAGVDFDLIVWDPPHMNCGPKSEALFGHLTKDGPGSQTYWCMLRRLSDPHI